MRGGSNGKPGVNWATVGVSERKQYYNQHLLAFTRVSRKALDIPMSSIRMYTHSGFPTAINKKV